MIAFSQMFFFISIMKRMIKTGIFMRGGEFWGLGMEKTRKVQQILYGLKIRAHALMIKIPQSGLTRIILSSVWHIYLTSMLIQV